MSKTIVKFLKTHGRYVKGDVAGFDPETIAAWPKGVCKPYDPDEKLEIASVQIDTSEAQKLIDDARAEFEQKAAALDSKSAELDAREEAVAAREQAQAEPAATEDNSKGASNDAAKTSAGTPPKQGAKA